MNTVSPQSMLKGLSQNDDVFITEDGQNFPRDANDREAEIRRVREDDCDVEEDVEEMRVGNYPIPPSGVGVEANPQEEVEEGFVKARLAPRAVSYTHLTLPTKRIV